MKPQIGSYFWSVNDKALGEIRATLRDPGSPRFAQRLIELLSRCDEPKELFRIVPEALFLDRWPKVRRTWRQTGRNREYLHWWDAIYESRVAGKRPTGKESARGSASAHLQVIGNRVREARLSREWSQADLAQRAGMAQRKISAIEGGKANITLATLLKVARALGIREIRL